MNKINKKSIPDLLKDLWSEGFFSIARPLSGIKKELSKRGFNFPITRLSVSALRVIKKQTFLSREKKDGQWCYIQRIPPEKIKKDSKDVLGKYNLHPKIKAVAMRQFKNKHFKEAIQNAFVEVINEVKKKSKYPKKNKHELDGDVLMGHVFSPDGDDKPKIRLNNLKNSLDKSEQRGFMFLFKGIVGLRNKKAHLNFVQNDPLKTIEYLALASLLMRILDEN